MKKAKIVRNFVLVVISLALFLAIISSVFAQRDTVNLGEAMELKVTRAAAPAAPATQKDSIKLGEAIKMEQKKGEVKK